MGRLGRVGTAAMGGESIYMDIGVQGVELCVRYIFRDGVCH